MSKEKKKVCTPPGDVLQALDERLVGVAYKTVAKDRGHMLNLCPFCGESLEWWGPQSDTDEAAEGGERSGS